jgi:hypothetical protein
MAFIRRVSVGSICAVLMMASGSAGQDPDKKVDVSIALKVAGQTLAFNGKGECNYEPAAYIYGTKSQLWKVEGRSAQGSASLTLWRPASGSGDMISLYVTAGGKSYAVNTVRTSGSAQGSGKVTFTPVGGGGTFTIDATAANGGRITGTLKCSAFTSVVVEGG